MRFEKRMLGGILALICCLVLPALLLAQPGTLIKNVPLPVPGVGVSVAVDCDGNVYYTNVEVSPVGGTDNKLHKMDKDGNLISSTLILDASSGAPVFIDEMAWDQTQGLLWGVEHNSNPIDVYTIDPATGLATFEFTAGSSISVGVYRDGIAFDGTDGTIWISGDISTTIEHYQADGTFINQITPKDSLGNTLGNISGVIVGVGDLLYLGQNGLVKIVQVKKSNGDFIADFASPGGARDEGLECDPVNFAPKLALWSRDYFSPGFMSVIEIEEGTCACGGGVETLQVNIDIKPQSCPNPLNVKNMGVIPVAILGTADFDVSEVDPSTVMLEGVAPLRWSMEDVATPVSDGEECECTTLGADGFMDLVFHFDAQSVIAALGPVTNFTFEVLTLTGNLSNDTPFEGQDCVRIQIPGSNQNSSNRQDPTSTPTKFSLNANYPNPFNANTTISYALPKDAQTQLAVYNIRGQKVKTLVDQYQTAGVYSITWDGKDESGKTVASGIYFYRLRADKLVLTNRMTLLK